jgi:hypothetical protein
MIPIYSTRDYHPLAVEFKFVYAVECLLVASRENYLKAHKLRLFMKQERIFPEATMQQETFEIGNSRQAVALAKKALSYQKRQTFTNVCCIRYRLCNIVCVR